MPPEIVRGVEEDEVETLWMAQLAQQDENVFSVDFESLFNGAKPEVFSQQPQSRRIAVVEGHMGCAPAQGLDSDGAASGKAVQP